MSLLLTTFLELGTPITPHPQTFVTHSVELLITSKNEITPCLANLKPRSITNRNALGGHKFIVSLTVHRYMQFCPQLGTLQHVILECAHNPALPTPSTRSFPELRETLSSSCEVEDQTLQVTRAKTARATHRFLDWGSTLSYELIKILSLSRPPVKYTKATRDGTFKANNK